ncbi:hypothetical protein AJ79_02997 [Helicocarpus griseus UAMH5409]|uniref:Major facilitator superfamily (MFS) profile domain-containing protein n=1 Tax=Helicocarpus griseus UAMH5409 TaxID=1447875 RepID=A0A2B7XRV8_9EURO|nr:hypothetical protein AJ79_02997 [Helicocarpus griseus UAMH5409]
MGGREDAEKGLADQMNILPKAQVLIVYSALAFALLLSFVNQNGISVMLPKMAEELDGQESISWAGTSSLIGNTVFSVLYGRLSDIFGRKGLFMSVLGVLALASLMCGFAQTPEMLYFFRAMAGIADGGVMSLTMIILSDIVTLKDRGKYQGLFGVFIGVGNVIGPFIAAAFLQLSTWRGFFFLLVPLSTICGLISFWLIPTPKGAQDLGLKNVGKIDFAGLFCSTTAIIFILIPISGGGSYFPWESPMIISMLVIGGLALIAFLYVEWKVAYLPMFPLNIFRNKVAAVLLLQSALMGAAYQSYLYYLPVYFQNVRQWTSISSAALTAAMVGTQATFSFLGGQYMTRMNRYGEVIWVGFGLWTLGTGLACMFDRKTHPAVIAVVISVVGAGVGCIFQPTLVAIQANCSNAQRAVAISNRNFCRCMGGAIGLAVSATILQQVLKASLPSHYSFLAGSTYSVPAIPEQDMELVLNAYMKASRGVFILQAPIIGLCFILCVFVKDNGLVKEEPRDPESRVGTGLTTDTECELAGKERQGSRIGTGFTTDTECELMSKGERPGMESRLGTGVTTESRVGTAMTTETEKSLQNVQQPRDDIRV